MWSQCHREVAWERVTKKGAHRDYLPVNLGLELFTLLGPPDFLPTQPINECGGCLHLLPAHVGIVEQVLHSEMRNISDNISKLLSRDVLHSHLKLHGGISQLAK